ncbi:MAG: hypothetical protein HOV80_08820 [Polyangiaceae bacterium]|nr:hypothetical protein [Polyangiaceae bacterium]
MRRRAWWSVVVFATALSAGCGAEDATEEAWESEVRGAAHAFVLRSEGSVREGPNAFDLEIEPIDGSALDPAATVSVVVHMRAMTHSEQEVEVRHVEAGSFSVGDVIFAMPGTWDLEISVEEGASVDRATFELDVP